MLWLHVRPVCVLFACLAMPAPLAAATQEKAWPPEAAQFQFHMIGNGHIDPVWLWPWQEGLSVVHGTFRSALDRMTETPGFTFTASSAQFYEWVAQNDPAMLAEIRKRIQEDRWGMVGGWWVEPDMNIPSGESFARHGLYSQRLFRQLFGRISTTGFNPDSFGHPATLPQIYKLEGMDNYVMMRPEQHEKKLPADLFWWEGPDGTRLLTYRIPFSYVDRAPVEGRLRRMISDLREPVRTLMAYYGVGDHGGGPTRLNIQSILEVQKQPGAPQALFSTPDRYFQQIRKMLGLDLPVVRDDLQHHAVGCYTAMAEIKKNNRAAEAMLVTGEKLAVLGSVLAGLPYPKAEFTAAWKKVLFQQFHDIMAGTSLPEHYEAARNAQGFAMETAGQALYRAAQTIAWQTPAADPDSLYLMVFNPHAWPAALDVEYDLDWPQRLPDGSRTGEAGSLLENERGAATPHQWTQASTVTGSRARLVFRAEVPAFGYRQFRGRRAAQQQWHRPSACVIDAQTEVCAAERGLENEHLRVSFAPDGSLSIFDKQAGQQVFTGAGGARAVVLDDPSDTWSHGVRDYSKGIGRFADAEFRVMENGPLRAVVRVRSRYGRSELETDWLLYAGSRTLEARAALDWHERQKMLKLSFPVDVQNPSPTYEVAYGHIVRRAEGEEDPGQRWVDLAGSRAGSAFGLAVINDAKYGYSVQGGDLRVSIARGAVYAHHDPRKLDPNAPYSWQDQGRQTFRMLLVPHGGAWQEAGIVRLAEQFVAPAPVVYQGVHAGRRPLSASFLSVDAPNVVVSAVKKAEDGEDLIVRCYETAGRAATATLDLGLVRRRWTGRFRPSEIKTLRVPLSGGPIREVNLLEE